MGYLTTASIGWCLQYLASTYPSICQLITLSENSIDGRTIRAVKIAGSDGEDRRGVLFIGGVHAREIVNPDLLVRLAFRLCNAYDSGSGLTFGGKSYSKETIQMIVDSLDLYIFPLVNPDGREYVQSPTGDAWWRKNRNPNPGLPCKGVDLNRNFDFLWSSGIGTSTSSCSQTYKGTGAFSEPETRNVRHMLDTHPNICCMVDVHSYSELILYPWGDDESQSTNPSMSFTNPTFDGLRGTLGDTLYKEYIPQEDLDWYVDTANRVRDAIAAVRGRVYAVQPSVNLYPTTAVSNDSAYARHFVDSAKRRVLAYVFETGTEFQPPFSEGLNIMSEVSAGLVEFCGSCLCVAEEVVRGTALARKLVAMRKFRDRDLVATRAGRTYVRMLDMHSAELLRLVRKEPRLRKATAELMEPVFEIVQSRSDEQPLAFKKDVLGSAEELLEFAADKASPELHRTIKRLRSDLKHFEGRSVMEGLKRASDETIEP